MKIHSVTIEHEGDLYNFSDFSEGGYTSRKNGNFIFLSNIPEKVVLAASIIFQEVMPSE